MMMIPVDWAGVNAYLAMPATCASMTSTNASHILVSTERRASTLLLTTAVSALPPTPDITANSVRITFTIVPVIIAANTASVA